MKLTSRIMGNTHAYRLWQAPFAEDKFAPVLAHNDLRCVRRVLDVGCGPGTNALHFRGKAYLGIDCNPAYIDYAQRRYKGEFIVADATAYRVHPSERFDFILLNSFLHHIDNASASRLLSHLGTLLTDDGCIHILDLVLPERRSIARYLALMDRGEFPRPLQEWQRVFADSFEPVAIESYTVNAFGAALWNMVYFKGRARK